ALYLLQFHYLFAFFKETPPPELYPLSLHDALPIWRRRPRSTRSRRQWMRPTACSPARKCRLAERHGRRGAGGGEVGERPAQAVRSEEHTSELQSRENLVCRLLLEKKKKKKRNDIRR